MSWNKIKFEKQTHSYFIFYFYKNYEDYNIFNTIFDCILSNLVSSNLIYSLFAYKK